MIILAAAVAACVSADGISSFPTAKHGPVGYHGPLAKPIVLKDGHIADTHEVAAARHAHYAAVEKAGGYGSGGDDYYGYGGGYEYASGHGVYSYGPGTGDLYKGEHGYAGLYSEHGYQH